MQYIALGIGLVLAFVFSHGKPQHKQDAQKAAEQYIGVVVPYQPAKAEEQAPSGPVKVADVAPSRRHRRHWSPQPPAAPAFRIPTPQGIAAKPIRPAMLSYVVHTDPPKPSTCRRLPSRHKPA